MSKKLLCKVVGCAVALAVIVPVVCLPVAASCPLTSLLYNYLGNSGGNGNNNINLGNILNNGNIKNSNNNNNTSCNANSNTCNDSSCGNSNNIGNILNNAKTNSNAGSSCGNNIANNNNYQSILNGFLQNNAGKSNSNNSNSSCPLNNGSCGNNNYNSNYNNASAACVGDDCDYVCEDGNCDDYACDDCDNCDDNAKAILDLVNIERKKAGVKPLTLDDNLCKAANTRSKEIITSFSHTRPNGKSFSTAVEGKYKTLGENIAAGYRTPDQVVKAWMGSAGHRANILNPNYTKLGVGYAESNGLYCCYWTQIFGS